MLPIRTRGKYEGFRLPYPLYLYRMKLRDFLKHRGECTLTSSLLHFWELDVKDTGIK